MGVGVGLGGVGVRPGVGVSGAAVGPPVGLAVGVGDGRTGVGVGVEAAGCVGVPLFCDAPVAIVVVGEVTEAVGLVVVLATTATLPLAVVAIGVDVVLAWLCAAALPTAAHSPQKARATTRLPQPMTACTPLRCLPHQFAGLRGCCGAIAW